MYHFTSSEHKCAFQLLKKYKYVLSGPIRSPVGVHKSRHRGELARTQSNSVTTSIPPPSVFSLARLSVTVDPSDVFAPLLGTLQPLSFTGAAREQ